MYTKILWSSIHTVSFFSTIEILVLLALSNEITHGCFWYIYVLLFSLNISFDGLLNSGSMKFSLANFTQYSFSLSLSISHSQHAIHICKFYIYKFCKQTATCTLYMFLRFFLPNTSIFRVILSLKLIRVRTLGMNKLAARPIDNHARPRTLYWVSLHSYLLDNQSTSFRKRIKS